MSEPVVVAGVSRCFDWGAHAPSSRACGSERVSRSRTSASAMINNNQPITNNFSAAGLTRGENRADDVGSCKLGTRFGLEFPLNVGSSMFAVFVLPNS